MTPDARRAAIVTATLPLLREKGRAVSTREIAKAAGVAEGTLFRAFDNKDEIITACVHEAFDNAGLLADLTAIDRALPLRDRLAVAVGVMQEHLKGIFTMMSVLQATGQPLAHPTGADAVRRRREATGPVASPMGPAVLAGLAARTWLAEHTDDELLEVAWRCADDVTEERHGRPGDTDPTVILLRQGGGLGRVVRLGTAGAALVSVCDGSLSAGAAVAAIASLLGVDETEVRAEVLPLLRALVADGLLV